MLTRVDLVMRAQAQAEGLSDPERIALGVALIGTAQEPDSWAALRFAARLIEDQSTRHLQAVYDLTDAPVAPSNFTTPATHGRSPVASQPPRRHRTPFRAVWGRIRRAERRFSNSIWGDALGALCLCALGAILFFFAGVLQ
jgi:hypothetical protein